MRGILRPRRRVREKEEIEQRKAKQKKKEKRQSEKKAGREEIKGSSSLLYYLMGSLGLGGWLDYGL